MDNFNEDEIAFLSRRVDGKQSNYQALNEVEPTSSLRLAWSDINFQQFNSNTYVGNNILHPMSTIPGPYCSPSYRVHGPTFGDYQRVFQQPNAIDQNRVNGPATLHPISTVPGPNCSPSNRVITGSTFGQYHRVSQQPIAISQNRANGPTSLHPISTFQGSHGSPSNRVINGPSFGEEYQRVSQQPTIIAQNVSRSILPSACVSERATRATSGYYYTNFLPSSCITGPGSYQSPSGTVLPSTKFIQNKMGGTLRSSVKHLPHSSITGERNVSGTKSTPIQIPDSPIRENKPVQYERTYCPQRGKRDRSEFEVESLHPSHVDMKKKLKLLHEPEMQSMRRPSYPYIASFNSPASTSDESNLSSRKSSTNCVAKRDDVEQVDGRIIVPIGKDLILDKLLCTYGYSNENELPSLPPGPDVWFITP